MRCAEATQQGSGVAAERIRFKVEPRVVPPAKAARVLHLTADAFTACLPALLNAGFPRPCGVTGHYDLKAIHAWQDRRSGLGSAGVPAPEDYDAIMRAGIEALG